jgi:flagellar motor switch protein FliM
MTATTLVRAVDSVRLGTAAPTRPDFPGLERVGAKVARGLVATCAGLGGVTRVTCSELRTMPFGEWKAGLPPAVAVARFRERAIRGGLLLSVPPTLITVLVDLFYGGDGAVDPSAGSLGAAGRKLFDRFATTSGEALASGWAEAQTLSPSLIGTSHAAEDVALGKSGDVVAVQQFAFEDPAAGTGVIEIVYPLTALRGIPALTGQVETVAEEADPAWKSRLSDAVMQARLPVRTVIARPTLALNRLLSLAPGDVIPVTLPARVPLTVAGRLLAHGTIGEANGRAAIMIDKLEQGTAFDD